MKHILKKIRLFLNDSTIKQWLYIGLYLLTFFYVIINIISSQLISRIYFQLVNSNKSSTVTFLQKIKDFPEFGKILEMNKNIYGKTIEKEAFQQENEKKLLINNLEQKLLINPKARDILYGLYQLYSAEGDSNRASDYLKRAKEVDPSLK
ncbi:MAG: hypothetical protein AAB437_03945 [Patescibacteria group bacterium]